MKTMYKNGTIITMDEQEVEVLVEEDGKIVALGKEQNLYEEGMRIKDLQGKCLLPSFIDGHSHFSGVAMAFLQVDLSNCTSIQEVIDTIQTYVQNNPKKQFITCQGYDHLSLKEKRHIKKVELDAISTTQSIIIQHQSGHNGVMNTKALAYLHIDETSSFDGGKVDFEQGFLEENAFIENVKKIPLASMEELKEAFQKAQQYYASYGITTIQEGMLVNELYDIYQMLIHQDLLYLDVVGYAGFDSTKFIEDFDTYKNYKHHFKLGGYKMFLDGSPQNKTAWTIAPYVDGSCGYPTLSDEQIRNCLQKAIREHRQVLAHCNGDQAIQHYLDAYKKVKQEEIRPVIVHAQMMNEEQLNLAKELNMIPSFFVAHVHYFGDIHIENMGYDRASKISPLKSASACGLLFTLHQDSPVLPPNMLETLQIANTRVTKNNKLLGVHQCISIKEGLCAITSNASYQYFEEKEKGTLTVGKKADMVILNKNPLIHDIRDVYVEETIKEGKIVYKRK